MGGYIHFNAVIDKKLKTPRLHRVLAECFIEIPERLKGIPVEKLQINHINYKRDDNRIENLEWVTAQENTIWSAEHISEAIKNSEKYKEAMKKLSMNEEYLAKKRKILQERNKGDSFQIFMRKGVETAAKNRQVPVYIEELDIEFDSYKACAEYLVKNNFLDKTARNVQNNISYNVQKGRNKIYNKYTIKVIKK